MMNCNCTCKSTCGLLAVAASIIIGIVTAFLTITAAITVTPAFLWVALGIAVVYLGLTLFTSVFIRDDEKRCACRIIPTLLAGILGTILVSIILLGITFAATSVIGAIITGLLLLFLTLIFTSTACLVKCLANCDNNI